MVEEKVIIDMLTSDSVSIKKEKYYNGELVGLPHRTAYVNSSTGRSEIEELGEPYRSAIFSMWGEEATTNDIIDEEERLGVSE